MIYPEFLQSPVWERRISLFEKLQRADMLERRMHIDIPEFYVGELFFQTKRKTDKKNFLYEFQRNFQKEC